MTAPANFTQDKRSRLAVVDQKIKDDRMPPHTAIIKPTRLADGEAICRCVELIVRFATDPFVEDNLLATQGQMRWQLAHCLRAGKRDSLDTNWGLVLQRGYVPRTDQQC